MAPEVLISKRGGGLQEREDKSRIDWSTPYDEWLVPTLNRFRYGGAIECRAIPSEIQLNIEALIRAEKLKLLDKIVGIASNKQFKDYTKQDIASFFSRLGELERELEAEL